MSEHKQTPAWHLPLPKRARLIKRKDVVNEMGVNMKIAVWITDKVGTMWVAYLFALLALVSLPGALASGNTVVIVGWIAQTFLQLVLLPIIMVGQNVQSAHADARAEADYEVNQKAEMEIEKLLEGLRNIDERTLDIVKRLEARTA